MHLQSLTGFYMAITERGRVVGIKANDNYQVHKRATMQISSVPQGRPGFVRIQAMETKFYLAMNKRGRLYGERNPRRNTTIFFEAMDNGYNTYRSEGPAQLRSGGGSAGWYVALDRRGRAKPGPRTALGQRAVRFVPKRI